MKYSILAFLAISLSLNLFSQNQKVIIKDDKIIIPINTELKISTKEKKEKISNFEIKTESEIRELIDMMSVLGKIEKKEIISDEIDFKFSKADFMGSKIIILTTLQHYTKSIIFKAKIRIKGTENYVETSIVPKAPNVFSVEQWNDDIDSIILFDFRFDEK